MGKGRRGKLLISCSCPAGAGSSTMIMLQAKEVLEAHGLGRKVQIDAVGSSFINDNSADILVCTMNLANKFSKKLTTPVVGMKNVMSAKEYEEKLLPVVKELLEKEGDQ